VVLTVPRKGATPIYPTDNEKEEKQVMQKLPIHNIIWQ
jgi:hypothetical protein